MALFYFILKMGRNSVPDRKGQELANESEARLHAVVVARELMRNREIETRPWRIEVCNDDLEPLFDVHFADVDETAAPLPERLRRSIEDVARTVRAANGSH